MKTFLVTIALVVLAGCTANPVKEAVTFEQKAFALYGTYVIFQGKAAGLVQESTTPEKMKQALREADRVSYPLAGSLADAAGLVEDIREALNQCPLLVEPDPQCVPTNEQRLTNALANLSSVYFQAAPLMLNLVSAVKGAKKP